MTEFHYSNHLPESFRKEMKYRRYFWSVCISPFILTSILYLKSNDFYLSVLCTLGFIGIVFLFEFFLRKHMEQTLDLVETFLIYKNHKLILLDKNQNPLSSIDTDKPFKVSYNFHVTGNAIYKVEQSPNKKLSFSSRINDAEYLITKILRQKEWPPGDDD